MNIGERLLELRKQKGLSQEEVADQVGVTRQTVSKWEVGESKPDFDKIIPLCDLFSITTEELLRGEKGKEEQPVDKEDVYDRRKIKRKTAMVLSISIFLYFLSISWIILASSFEFMSDEFMVSVFLLICAIATSMIVYHFVSIPKEKERNAKLEKRNSNKRLDSIIAMIFTAIYLYISFTTGAWYITWILWIVYSIVIEITHLILEMKGEKNSGKE